MQNYHYQVKCKCTHCKLHFIVLSWSEDWPSDNYGVYGEKGDQRIYCPECGKTGIMIFGRIEVEQPIYEICAYHLSQEQTVDGMRRKLQKEEEAGQNA